MDITIKTIFDWGKSLIDTSGDIVSWFSSEVNILGMELSMANVVFGAGILGFATFIIIKFITDIIA